MTPAIPTMRPADRSVPPRMMMPATPRAMMSLVEDCWRMDVILRMERNEGSRMMMTAMTHKSTR